MIEILPVNTPQYKDWFAALKSKLYTYKHLFTSHPDLILDKVLRGEYVTFNVNDELTVIGFVYNHGISRTFYIYWMEGKNIRGNLNQMMSYAKSELGCETAELKSNTPAHHSLYRQILKPYNPQESLLFRVDL